MVWYPHRVSLVPRPVWSGDGTGLGTRLDFLMSRSAFVVYKGLDRSCYWPHGESHSPYEYPLLCGKPNNCSAQTLQFLSHIDPSPVSWTMNTIDAALQTLRPLALRWTSQERVSRSFVAPPLHVFTPLSTWHHHTWWHLPGILQAIKDWRPSFL